MALLAGCGKVERFATDASAAAEYQAIDEHLRSAKSVSFDYDMSLLATNDKVEGHVRYLDPKHFEVLTEERSVHAVGDALYIVHPPEKTYIETSAYRTGVASLKFYWGINSLETMTVQPIRTGLTYGDFQGDECVVRSLEFAEGNHTEKLYIYYSRQSKEPRGYVLALDGKDNIHQETLVKYSHIRLNPKLAASALRYQPPSGYTQVNSIPKLSTLKPGRRLPKIELSDLNGNRLNSEVLSAHAKGLLLVFWSHG